MGGGGGPKDCARISKNGRVEGPCGVEVQNAWAGRHSWNGRVAQKGEKLLGGVGARGLRRSGQQWQSRGTMQQVSNAKYREDLGQGWGGEGARGWPENRQQW